MPDLLVPPVLARWCCRLRATLRTDDRGSRSAESERGATPVARLPGGSGIDVLPLRRGQPHARALSRRRPGIRAWRSQSCGLSASRRPRCLSRRPSRPQLRSRSGPPTSRGACARFMLAEPISEVAGGACARLVLAPNVEVQTETIRVAATTMRRTPARTSPRSALPPVDRCAARLALAITGLWSSPRRRYKGAYAGGRPSLRLVPERTSTRTVHVRCTVRAWEE